MFRNILWWQTDISPLYLWCRLTDVLVVEPDNENAIFGLGIIRYNFGNFQEAIKLFNRTLQLNASHPGALYNLGYTCIQQQMYPEALPALARLVKLDPLHVNALTHLGTCYVHLKQYRRAVEFYEAALRVDPGNALTLFNLGTCSMCTHTQHIHAWYYSLLQNDCCVGYTNLCRGSEDRIEGGGGSYSTPHPCATAWTH